VYSLRNLVNNLSLKSSLLLVILFFSLATLSIVLVGTDHSHHQMMLKRNRVLIERDMGLLRRQIDENLGLYGWEAVERNLVAFGETPEVLAVAVLDRGLNLQVTSGGDWRMQASPGVLPQFDEKLARLAIEQHGLEVDFESDEMRLAAYAPVTIPSHRGANGEFNVGVLFLLYDISQFAEQMHGELWRQAVLFCGVGALALLGLLLYMRRLISRPLTQLATAAQQMAGGAYDLRLPVKGANEIGKLASALNQFSASAQAYKEDISRRHARLNDYLQSGVVGMLVIDTQGGIQEMNRVLSNITGYSLNELYAESWLEICHPDDRKNLYSMWRRLLLRPGMERSLEFRLCDRDNREHWVDAVAKYEQGCGDESGHVLVFLRDVTKKKMREEELRLAAAAFNTHEAIVITDAQGSIVKVNSAFTEITGYRLEEVIGKNPRIFQSGYHDAEFYKAMWHTIRSEGIWQGEIWNKRKGGEVYPEYETIMAVKDNGGEITQYIAFFEDITQRKVAEKRIEQLAYYDELTKLPNRRMLTDRLQQAVSSAKRHSYLGALLFVDLDHFKDVNDSLGHLVGDKLLFEVANRLGEHIRQEDTLARLGGDEFVILVHCLDDNRQEAAEHVRALGERILEDVSKPYFIEGHHLHINASIGVSFFPEDSDNLTDLIRQADTAMYQSKAAGRGVVRFFSQDMQESVDLRLLLRTDLKKALALKEFDLYLQPQICVGSGKVVGAESLIRWKHPRKGYISPADFIPVAEEDGIIVDIGEYVLRQACGYIRDLRERGEDVVIGQIAVNISPLQFRSAGFVETVKTIIEEYGISGRYLCFELTEGVLLKNVEQAIDIIRDLKMLGISFAIDDFGTGYSSLGYLSRLPLDRIKIDKSFIDKIPDDPQGVTIVDAVLSMAQHLGVDVIAEGVETLEQLRVLKQRHCYAYQGYYGAKPMPFSQYVNYLASVSDCYYVFDQMESEVAVIE